MSFFREHVVKNYQSLMPIKALGGTRSKYWRRVRKAFIKKHAYCFACGRRKKLQVHHIKDFSTRPELELEESNLMTLCMGGTKCHFVFGHLGKWKSINPAIISDAILYYRKIISRR